MHCDPEITAGRGSVTVEMLRFDVSDFTARQQLSTKFMRPVESHTSAPDPAVRHRHSREYASALEDGEFEPTDEVIDEMNLMPNFHGVRLQEFKSSVPGTGSSRWSWRDRSLQRLPSEKREELAREAWRKAVSVYHKEVKGDSCEDESPKPVAPSVPIPHFSRDQLRKQCCLLL
jgi:hypothetical protein